jgi:hypothetical protein
VFARSHGNATDAIVGDVVASVARCGARFIGLPNVPNLPYLPNLYRPAKSRVRARVRAHA